MAEVIAERDGFRPVVIKDSDDQIGIVTVHDGPSLPSGEIIAPVVGRRSQRPGDLSQQLPDADRFLKAGGQRGRQYRCWWKAPTISTACSRPSK